MKRLILLVVLFLPIPTLANIKSYGNNGFSDQWCDQYNCYALSTTKTDTTMSGHKYQAYVQLVAPDGSWAWKDTGLVNTLPTAKVAISHKSYKMLGEWQQSGQTGRRTCPWGQPRNAQYYSRRLQLGASIICLERGNHLDTKVCSRIYTLGLQTGWQCTYFPISPCGVKCQVSMYSIYILGNGNIVPAPRGEVVKGWTLNPESGSVKCDIGFIMQFYPSPCVSCKERIIGPAI